MSKIARCPKCDGTVSVGGICPRCAADFLQAAPTESPGESPLFSPPRPQDLAPLFPQLDIIKLIGRGGMGAVYKARQKDLDRTVALKILPPGIGQDTGFAGRFAREAIALAKLNHPGIVTIYDFGRADGLYFFLMELVDGVNLRQLLDRGRISPREALAIVPQICDALQFAHDQGVVHRDIKPENILLDRRGRVKVADFGLAKIVASEEPSVSQRGAVGPEAAGLASALTEGGKILGTPPYMAPEQAQHPEAVDHRADIYALGMVFYQMLTGQLPAHPIQPPSSKVQIDVRLDEVVLRALEKNPETRYQQASALKTQVETIAATPSNQTAPQTRLQPSITKMNGNTHISIWSWTGVVVVAACLFALGLAMFHKNVKPSQSQAVDSQSLGGFKQSKAELAEEQAFIRMANGDLEAYIADRTKLIELKPGDAASYHLRGYAKQIKGDFDGAIADYTKAINLGMPISYYTRAYSKQLKNDLDGAIADYTQVIELNPNDAQAYFHRGLAKQAQGNLAGAAADHSKAIELKPDLESQ